MNLNAQETQPAEPSYREIPLTKGRFAIVDAADYPWLAQWRWIAHFNQYTRSYYAVRVQREFPGPKGQKKIRMHRQILGVPDGVDGDHEKTGTRWIIAGIISALQRDSRTASTEQCSAGQDPG